MHLKRDLVLLKYVVITVWHLFVQSGYTHIPRGRVIITCCVHGKVTSFVDGVNEKSATMEYELAQPMTRHRSSSLFLGHCRSLNQQLPHNVHYQLGNIFLFNGHAFCITFYIVI